MPANLENSAAATGLKKVSFHSNPKECLNHHTTALISHSSKVMLKVLQARLQQYMNCELPDVRAGFEIKLPTSTGSSKKQESSRKTSISALLTTPKHLAVWITTNCGKFWKIWEYQTTWPASWETCMQVRKQQVELDMEQTGSKSGKEYVKAVYCHSAYMQSTSCEMPGWMKHKLESRLPGEITITLGTQMIPPLCQKAKKNWRASLWKWKRRMKKLT